MIIIEKGKTRYSYEHILETIIQFPKNQVYDAMKIKLISTNMIKVVMHLFSRECSYQTSFNRLNYATKTALESNSIACYCSYSFFTPSKKTKNK